MRRRPQFTRAERLGHLLQDEVIQLVNGEIRSALAQHVVVTASTLSPDLAHLRVCYVMEGSDDPNPRAQAMLESAGGFVAGALRRSLQLRRTPKVVFTFDSEYVRLRRVRELLALDQRAAAAEATGNEAEAAGARLGGADLPTEAPDDDADEVLGAEG